MPVIHFVRGQRKDDVAARYRARFTANEGVVFIGIAQEKMNALSDPRVLALLQALCQVAPRPGGFRHRDLRPIVAGLLGRDLAQYSAGAMTYDLRRLRLHSLIQRVPHSFRYTLTTNGLRLAFGISRIVLRLLQPGWDDLLRSDLNLPTPLREALLRLDAALHSFADTDCPPAKAA